MTQPTVKRIVCLANSRKYGGSCVAGREIPRGGGVGGWVRPVSDRDDEAVAAYERQYEDGGEPQMLDVIDIPLLEARPKSFQRENWLLDPNRRWKKVARMTQGALARLAAPTSPLWINGFSATGKLNDRAPVMLANTLSDSLRLIRVDALTLTVAQPSARYGDGRKKLRGRFRHGGVDYCFDVTDPVYESEYRYRPNGNYPIGERFLTVSLGEPYHGYAYKLIAAVIEP